MRVLYNILVSFLESNSQESLSFKDFSLLSVEDITKNSETKPTPHVN